VLFVKFVRFAIGAKLLHLNLRAIAFLLTALRVVILVLTIRAAKRYNVSPISHTTVFPLFI
jgi:hypothetical protein